MDEIKVLINEEELQKRIKQMAEQLTKEYEGKELTLICILKGSIFFTVDLAKYMPGDVKIDFVRVSSYKGENSTGEIRMKLDLKGSIQGKDVIIIEDIIDTGRTLKYLKEYLNIKKPNSLKICTLLDKKERRVCSMEADYVGFTIPDKFIVGFGLDYNEKYRNLPYIGYIDV